MNQQTPGQKSPTLFRIPISILSFLLLLSTMACVPSMPGASDTDEPPAATDTPPALEQDDTEAQVATSVARTVIALEQDTAPPSQEPTDEDTAPSTQPPPTAAATTAPPTTPPEPTLPMASGDSACGRGTADVCDIAAVIEVEALSVRAAPDLNATYLDEVARDKRVDVLCIDEVQTPDRTWVCVRTLKGSDSVEGWMSTRYLAFGVPEAPALPACDQATVVEVDALTIRSEPTIQSNPIGEAVPRGGRVEVLCSDMVEADGRTWAHIRSGTVEGWMSTNYLAFDSASSSQPTASAPADPANTCGSGRNAVCDAATVIEVESLAVRAAPNRNAAYLGEVPEGRMVDVLCVDEVQADERTWVCVSTGSGGVNSVVGWMSTRYLAFDTPDQAATTPGEPVATVCDWATVVGVDAVTMHGEPNFQSGQMVDVPSGVSIAVFCGEPVEADGHVWVATRVERNGGFIVGWMVTDHLDFEFGGP